MVASTFEVIIDVLIDSFEKGFVHRSKEADPGGATKYGITQKTLSAWRNKDVSIDAVKKLTKDEAIAIYKAQYWHSVRGDDLPAGVDFCTFDFAVNSGPGRAAMTLQEVVGVKQDGIIGLMTLDAVKRYPEGYSKLIAAVCAARLKFMKGLSNWPHNKNGWTNRVEHVLIESQSLVKGRKPDMGSVSPTSQATADKIRVSKALISKESATILTVAIPSISGLLTNFQLIQYVIAAFIAGFGLLALYWAYQRVKKAAI